MKSCQSPFPEIIYKSHVTSRLSNYLLCCKFRHLMSKSSYGSWGDILWNLGQQEWGITCTQRKHRDEIKNIEEVPKWVEYREVFLNKIVSKNKIVPGTVFLLFITSSPSTLVPVASKDTYISCFHSLLSMPLSLVPPSAWAASGASPASCGSEELIHLNQLTKWSSEAFFAYVFNTCHCYNFSLTSFPR